MTTNSLPIIDKFNALIGVVIALLSYALGEHWILFVGFFVLNVLDFLTRAVAARIQGNSNSQEGAVGILKKFGYWVVILLAYIMSAVFTELGEIIGVNLQVSECIGLFVLGALIFNEFRSILENLVEAKVPVPRILVKGLKVANQAFDAVTGNEEDASDPDKKEG